MREVAGSKKTDEFTDDSFKYPPWNRTILHFESYSARIVERGAGIVIVDYNCKVGRSPAETGPGRKEGNDEGSSRPNALGYEARCRTARRPGIFCNVDRRTILTTVISLESVINSLRRCTTARGGPHARPRPTSGQSVAIWRNINCQLVYTWTFFHSRVL